MIQSASFRNFKSLRHVDVDLERLTVFVGPNASGKTSILEGLYYLSLLGSTDPKELFTGQRRPLVLYTRGPINEDMVLENRNNDSAFRLTICPPHDLSVMGEYSDFLSAVDWEWVFRLESRDLRQADSNWTEVKRLDSNRFRSAFLRLDARKLAEPSYSVHVRPWVENEGEGLASVLAFVALNQPDRFRSLQECLQSVIPSVKRIRFNRVPIYRNEIESIRIDDARLSRSLKKEYIGDEIVFDFQGASDIPAHLASEGTILVLGILATMLGPDRPNLVLLDDLDHGLHPKAQRKIIPLLRKLVDESKHLQFLNRDLQIIATTHSPYIVDELDPKEVRIALAGDDDGMTRCARLDSHPDFDRWKNEMWPGEFWSLVGEQWVANGQSQGRP
jgi:predicted ATPase